MPFRLEDFYRANRRAIIWAAILLVLWALHDFFALVFITFLLVSFTYPSIRRLEKTTRIPRAVWNALIHFAYLALLAAFVSWAVPSVISQAADVAEELRTVRPDLLRAREIVARYVPSVAPAFDAYVTEARVGEWVASARGWAIPKLRETARLSAVAIGNLLLGLLFSFLILLDLPRLERDFQQMSRSRLREFIQEGAEPVVALFRELSAAFRAQALIAVLTAILTGVAFWLLGLPTLGLLLTIVFVLGFIPVLGAILSTVPALFIALNVYGVEKAIWVVVAVVVVHVLVAYVITPIVYGRHFQLNPVVVLVVLLVGHHFFRVWGMLLGVPLYTYFVHYVMGVPRRGEVPPAAAGTEPPPPPPVPESGKSGAGT